MKHSVTWPWCHGTNTIFTSNQSLLCEHVAHSILGTDLIKHFFCMFYVYKGYPRDFDLIIPYHPQCPLASFWMKAAQWQQALAIVSEAPDHSVTPNLIVYSASLRNYDLGRYPIPGCYRGKWRFFFFGIWGSKNMIILVVTVSGGQPKWWPMMAAMEIV